MMIDFLENDRVIVKQGKYAGRVGKIKAHAKDCKKVLVSFKKKPKDKSDIPPLLANKDWLFKV